MRVCIVMVVVLLISGCNLLKNNSKTTDEQNLSLTHQSSLNTKDQKDWAKNSSSLLFYKDSAQRDYVVQLWPKGNFSYSAEKGFNGEADSLFIQGRTVEGFLLQGLKM